MESFLPGREEVGKREEKEMEGKKRRMRVWEEETEKEKEIF